MIREAYKLWNTEFGPKIVKAEITDLEAVSWRDAKKQLRRKYLEKAAALRQVTKQQYFGEQQ